MKKILFQWMLWISFFNYAQDLDIYKHEKNDKFVLPSIPEKMTYEEFKILSTDLRVQDMMIGVILPGHVHFKIREKKYGYYLLGARLLGYAGSIYLSAKNQSIGKILLKKQLDIDRNLNTGDVVLAYTSIFLIVGSYLYDWIHGKYLLDEKQTRIRYKYAPRKIAWGFSGVQIHDKIYPGVGITIQF